MWLILTILSYFFSAVVVLIDKFLVSKKIPQPIVYTFYISILSIFSLLLIFADNFVLPSFNYLIISFFTGGLSVAALLLFFSSLKINEASRVIPLIGSFTSVFSIPLSYLILKEKFSPLILIAIFFLLSGGFLMTVIKEKKKKFFIKDWPLIVLCSFLFSLFFILTKVVYQQLSFINGFIWIRLGSFLFALGFLIFNQSRKIILNSLKKTEKKISFLFLSNQGFSAIAFFLLNSAISLGNVALINALIGIQYVFVFILSLLISFKFPYLFKEELEKRVIIQKIFGIFSICLGLFILTIFS